MLVIFIAVHSGDGMYNWNGNLEISEPPLLYYAGNCLLCIQEVYMAAAVYTFQNDLSYIIVVCHCHVFKYAPCFYKKKCCFFSFLKYS